MSSIYHFKELSKKKILATKEDLNPNKKFINNRLINLLSESVSLDSYIELNNLNYWDLDEKYVQIIFDELVASELYSKYMDTIEDSYNVDRSFVISFFREIIALKHNCV
jgi:N utilization substance protein B